MGPAWYSGCGNKIEKQCLHKNIRPTRVIQEAKLKIINNDDLNFCDIDIQVDKE